MVDEMTLKKHIGSLIGMQNFRYYTKGSVGESILNFWCDAEKFRRHTPPELRRFLFREIQYKYLRNGSAYEVPNTIKCRIYGEKNNEIPFRQIAKNISIFSEDIFVSAQLLVVEDLYSYWVPKYILHKCRELATTYQQRKLSRATVAKRLKESTPKSIQRKAVHDSEMELEKEMKKRRSDTRFDSINEDEEFENEKNAFFETNRILSAESDEVENDSREESSFLPEIKSTHAISSTSLDQKVSNWRQLSFIFVIR